MQIDVKFAETDSEIKCDFGELFEKPQKEVYDSGYNDGYEDGESDGYGKGSTDGYNKGYGEGETSGYNNGYTVGKTDGYSEGYANGETAGYENGYDKGYDVGFDEGKESAATGANIDDLIDDSITEIYSEVKNVRQYAFYGCSQLTSADFPLATSIGSSTFSSCSQLTALILRSEKQCTLSNANAFNSTPIKSGTGYIYVPSALIDSYKSATNWSTYAAQFRALEDYTVDGTITGALDPEKTGA